MNPWKELSIDECTILQAIFKPSGSTRQALAAQLNFSKSKTNQLVAGLIEQGTLIEIGLQSSRGGRCPETIQFNLDLGILIGVDIGATSLNIAIMNLSLNIIIAHNESVDVKQGPCVVLARVLLILKDLLSQAKLTQAQIIGIGIGVPGPIDFENAQLVSPPLMPDWDGFSIRDFMQNDYNVPIFVDNDVNLMALAQSWSLQTNLQNFLVIKIGTGIGCGIICHGEVYRGATGSAGDVGHICVDQAGPQCRCGNLGCVEAMAAGPAIVKMALKAAHNGESDLLAKYINEKGILMPEDVGLASRNGDVAANNIIQTAGALIGQMLASVINFFNPSHVFIGGGLILIGPLFLAAIRQSIYQRSLALSTRHIEISYTLLEEQGGVIGAGVLAMQETLKLSQKRSNKNSNYSI